ncbi:N-acetyl-gamma-glutamyl-phosphate reductase [Corynebacterium poyangense]|uniref:N-acetyl-gamma-glutamyl-phosphate reductase n=1 Tax=Corynebacterium poyangense TaxID=2684405 RepID=A0A7H0SNN3_9CORY|nr:N-acetyl-gamma-glutamyl-phosphate reductase [Corynebacterium poyangense]QNQ90158.1 N-acetyl-gamma-glutamyl-phosphate reductase [Corynebacterium poyangense]
MSLDVAVVGATGYAGGEILRLLLGHPAYLSGELSIGALMGASSAGQRLGALMSHLPQLADCVIEETDISRLGNFDVVFLALPHGHSARVAEQVGDDTVVLDCAADFRLRDAHTWTKFYGAEHAGSWPYGIPEMPGHREDIRQARRVAVPGCFPTGATLALLPAVQSGLIYPDVVITSITGVSGAGKKAAVAFLGSETMGSLKAYNVAGQHRHTPEIAQNLNEFSQEPVTVSFTPVLAPLVRGILTTATAPIREGISDAQIRESYEKFCAKEPFLHLLDPGQQPQTQDVVGSNMCQLQVQLDEYSRRLVVTSAIDNLTKGTAGAAIQCMNLICGFPETAGLAQAGIAP